MNFRRSLPEIRWLSPVCPTGYPFAQRVSPKRLSPDTYKAKFYRLTRKGRAQLEAEAASWERLTVAVGLILRLSEGAAE